MICVKKKYTKPMFLVENFALTQQIAKCDAIRINFENAACVFKDNNASPEMKAIASYGGFYNGCSWVPENTSDGLCYFSNVHMVFSS